MIQSYGNFRLMNTLFPEGPVTLRFYCTAGHLSKTTKVFIIITRSLITKFREDDNKIQRRQRETANKVATVLGNAI